MLEVFATSIIVLIISMAVIHSLRGNRKIESELKRKVVAEQFASELLEYFRSLSTAQLKAHLLTHPTYDLCTDINASLTTPQASCAATVSQPDPTVDVAPSVLGVAGACAAMPCLDDPSTTCQYYVGVTRSYKIQVVNIANNLQVNSAACGTVNYDLVQPGERYLATVTVSWPSLESPLSREEVKLTTVIPRYP